MTNCSNYYGPYHFSEKLILLSIVNAVAGQLIPIYDQDDHIRTWLYVEDHARALVKVVFNGELGETYNVGGHNEHTNQLVVETLCDLLDLRINPKPSGIRSFRKFIASVADRRGSR